MTPEQLAAILSQPGYGIDVSATAQRDGIESPVIGANLPHHDTLRDTDGKFPLQSLFESTLTGLCQSHGLPPPEFEYKFHPSRRWRADAALPSLMVLIELEGGTWTNGRHVRGTGYELDCEKYNAAALLGWFVLRFTTGMLKDGRMLEMLQGLSPF